MCQCSYIVYRLHNPELEAIKSILAHRWVKFPNFPKQFASNSEERQTDTFAGKELEHARWLYEQQQSCYSHRKHI